MLTNINIINNNIMDTSISTLNMARSEPPVSDTITLWMRPNGCYPVVQRLVLTNDGFQTLTNVNEHIFCRRSIMWVVKRAQGDLVGATEMVHRNCHLRDYNPSDFDGMKLCGSSIAGIACRYGAECNFLHTLNYPQIIQVREPVIQELVVQEPIVQEPVVQEPHMHRVYRGPREKKMMCINIIKQTYSRLADGELPCNGTCGFAHSAEEQVVPPVVKILKNMIETNDFYKNLPKILKNVQKVLRNSSDEIKDRIFVINQSRTFPSDNDVVGWLTWWKKSVDIIRKDPAYQGINILNPFDKNEDENILWEICRRMTICDSSKAMAMRLLTGRWSGRVNICHGGKSCKHGVHIENINENGFLFTIDTNHLNGRPPTFNKNIVANRAVQLSELERLKVNRQNRYNETLTCHANQRVALEASLLTMKQSVDTACEKYLNMYNPIQLFKDPTPTSVTPVSNDDTPTFRSKSIPKPPMSPDEQKEKFFRTFTLSDMSLNTNEAWSRFCSKENNISNDVDIFYKRVCKDYKYWTESEIVTKKITEAPRTGFYVSTSKGWEFEGVKFTETEEIKECPEKALYHDFWAFLFNIPIIIDRGNSKKMIKPIAIVDDDGWRTPTPNPIENTIIPSLAHLSPDMLKETEVVKNIIKIRPWTVEESIKCDELPTEFILNSGGVLIRRSISDEILIPLIFALANEKTNITEVNELIKKLPITLDEAINQLNDVCNKYASQMNEKIKITCNSFIETLANSKIDSLYMDKLYNAINGDKLHKDDMDDMITYVRRIIDSKKHTRQHRVTLNHLFDDILRISKIDMKENIKIIKKNISIDVTSTSVTIQPVLLAYASTCVNNTDIPTDIPLTPHRNVYTPSSPVYKPVSGSTIKPVIKVDEVRRSRLESHNSIDVDWTPPDLFKDAHGTQSPEQKNSRFPNNVNDEIPFYCTNVKITKENGKTTTETTVIGPFDEKSETIKKLKKKLKHVLGRSVSTLTHTNLNGENTLELGIPTGREGIEKKMDKGDNHTYRFETIYDNLARALAIVSDVTRVESTRIYSPTYDESSRYRIPTRAPSSGTMESDSEDETSSDES